jgi:hypothetical protein
MISFALKSLVELSSEIPKKSPDDESDDTPEVFSDV